VWENGGGKAGDVKKGSGFGVREGGQLNLKFQLVGWREKSMALFRNKLRDSEDKMTAFANDMERQ
jgi:hypothetical protein